MMHLRSLIGLGAATILACLPACTPPPQSSGSAQASGAALSGEDVLFMVGDEAVPREEFMYVFEKNAINQDSTNLKKELDDYLQLYINFKLKVMEAEALGYPEKPDFQREFGQYRDQLAASYLTDHEASDKLIREAYSRLKEEVNASHILIQVSETAPPADTLKAYNKIIELRKQVTEGGADFEAVAKAESEDPSAARNGGNLGYFSAMQMVYPFENAAFETPVGEVSKPIRTRFGYHILKVNDRRPSAGKIQVSHIMIRATEGMPQEEMDAAQDRIENIAKRLKAGENWFELARQFSDDVRTKSRGGMLPWFGSGEMVVEFEKAAFGLDTLGEVSEPIQTAYGWHIIRLEDKQGLRPFNEMEPELKERIGRDSRSQMTQKTYIARLMRENGLMENEDSKKQAFLMADSTLFTGTWEVPNNPNLLKMPLFSLGGAEVTYEVDDFFQYVFAKQGQSQYQNPQQYMNALYERYREDMLLEYEKEHLADKYEDYRYLVKEYRDGILLFQLMEDKIWSKSVADTAGLRQFFNTRSDQYRWEERAVALILNATSKEVREQAKSFAEQERYPTRINRASIAWAGPIREVTKDQLVVLNEVINLLVNDPTAIAVLEAKPGGVDSSGYRQTLKYLTERGVSADRITTNFTLREAPDLRISIWSERSKAMEGFFNNEAALNLLVKEGLYERSKEPVLNEVPWKVGYHEVQWDNRYYGVWVRDIQPGAPKALNEVRGAAISDYQDHLEKEWIRELREKYTVQINEEALNAVYEVYDLD